MQSEEELEKFVLVVNAAITLVEQQPAIRAREDEAGSRGGKPRREVGKGLDRAEQRGVTSPA